MTESRYTKIQRKSKAKIEKLEIKEKIAILEMTILVLQESLDTLKMEDEGVEKRVEWMFLIGKRVIIIGRSQRVGDLCEVTDVMHKSAWVMAVDDALFLKRKQHVVIESSLHNVKHETDA